MKKGKVSVEDELDDEMASIIKRVHEFVMHSGRLGVDTWVIKKKLEELQSEMLDIMYDLGFNDGINS